MIRPACFLDIMPILNLGARYVLEEVSVNGHHSARWEPEMAAHHLAVAISSDNLFLWVAVDGCEVVGFLWGGLGEAAPWDSSLVANDYLFYLTPEYRGTRRGLALIKAWLSWGKSLGCQEVRLSIASGINEARIGKMFKLLGFDNFGTVYSYKNGGKNVSN